MHHHDITPRSDSTGGHVTTPADARGHTIRAIIAAVFAIAGLVCAPSAAAVPGQCWSSPFGGFCDQLPDADGSFMHCEQTGFGSSSYRNCYQACLDVAGRLYPTDYRFDTPC
jgi:hypothetical protein